MVDKISSYPSRTDHRYSKDVVESHINLLLNASEDEEGLIYSLILRECYGGMKGDQLMIRSLCDSVVNHKIESISLNVNLISPTTIRQLFQHEWLYDAIDFHCDYQIVIELELQFPDYDTKKVKEIMWNNSSSINVRDRSVLSLIHISEPTRPY